MNEETQRLLRAMVAAKQEHDHASLAQRAAWDRYIQAQAAFTGKFSSTQYPLGPFVVGAILVEQEQYSDPWPPKRDVFTYREVVRCPTSE